MTFQGAASSIRGVLSQKAQELGLPTAGNSVHASDPA